MAKWTYDNVTNLSKGRASILLWGPAITGKTTALATLTKYGPIHLFDFDAKCQSLVRRLEAQKELDKLVVYRYIPQGGDRLGATKNPARQASTFLDFQKDFNAYFDLIDSKSWSWKTPDGPGTIVFDSLSSYCDITLDFVLAQVGHDLGDPKTDARSDYGASMNKIMETIKSSKTLPCNVVWIAHEQMEKDEFTGQIRCDPYVTGRKLPAILAREFTIVLYSYTSTSKDAINYEWLVKPKNYVKSAGTCFRDDLPASVPQDFSLVLGDGAK